MTLAHLSDPARDPARPGTPEPGYRFARQCTAHARSGQRCGNPPIAGASVCRMHGGAAAQVRTAARLRLIELVDPAVGTLAREMVHAERSADRQRAANSVLDRAGVPRNPEPDAEVAREALLNIMLAIKARRAAAGVAAATQQVELAPGHSDGDGS